MNVGDDKASFVYCDQRYDIKAEIKVALILLLAEHDYPQVDRNRL